MKSYLFILGRNFELSKAELLNFCDEVFADKEKSLFIGENLKFKNPRNLPKTPEQIFLDRLGGTIRFGEIIGEYFSKNDLLHKIKEIILTSENPNSTKVGISVFGGGKNLLSEIIYHLKDDKALKEKKIRLENFQGKNMTSGQIFERKVLLKGFEFIVWKHGNSFLLAKTVANQNLRNYVLRDRKKAFRDAKMGMLPPKLAQILMNLANPKQGDIILDPFCGSGTINIEAGISGFKNYGSDLNGNFVKSAHENYLQMAQKFRYDENSGVFNESLVNKSLSFIDKADLKNIKIATEGFLGENFTKAPTKEMINENAAQVIKIWKEAFLHFQKHKIQAISFCLPNWNFKRGKISIASELFENIKRLGYEPKQIFGGQKTFIYERDKTFVAREICLVEKVK